MPTIHIEIDADDEMLYSLQMTKMTLSTFRNIIVDIVRAIDDGEYSPGQLTHPNLKVSSQNDDPFNN